MALHQLRAQIFQQDLEIIKNQQYVSETGKTVLLPRDEGMITHSKFYSKEIAPLSNSPCQETTISVSEQDCLVVARNLQEKNPCVLNMANRHNPGGGVLGGSGAQEEHLFRSSNYCLSLYQYAPYAAAYGLKQATDQYPMDRNYGGIYSPEVTVFRGPENEGYPLLDEPWKTSFVAVPAINNPDTYLSKRRSNADLNRWWKPPNERFRTILRIAHTNGHTTLVLSAFGCGAFRNPPHHMALIFQEVLTEPEFLHAFDTIVFAVINDHNSNGNYEAFKRVFG
ncbi:MAG: TIGR02452 family protein [Sphaerochaeta sp.]|nr:TIGR02452 family protein [Sphaerochaeta sp.]